MSDRRVHAVLPDGVEIVRYNRAGKWYRSDQRSPITIGEAVRLTGATEGAEVRLGLPGGARFDYLYGRDWGK